MHSDPIADLLTRIRNGLQARKLTIDCPHSKIKVEIVKILAQEGWLDGHEVITEDVKFPVLRVKLKYDHRRLPVIHDLRRISKPGLRVYRDRSELQPRRGGLTTVLLTTSQGLMTDRTARKLNVGGEVICEVS